LKRASVSVDALQNILCFALYFSFLKTQIFSVAKNIANVSGGEKDIAKMPTGKVL